MSHSRSAQHGLLLITLVLGLSACAPQKITPYVAASGPSTARLLMRGESLEQGDTYGVYVFGGAEDCSQMQRVGIGTMGNNPGVTTIQAGSLSTVEVLLTKPNRTYCRVVWSFAPKAGRSYLVVAGNRPGGCSVSILDATNPDSMKLESSLRRRDVPGKVCVPLASSKPVTATAGRADTSTGGSDLPAPPSASDSRNSVPTAVSDDDLKGLTGR